MSLVDVSIYGRVLTMLTVAVVVRGKELQDEKFECQMRN